MPSVCKHRGPLLLHAAKSWDRRALAWMLERKLIDSEDFLRLRQRSLHQAGGIFARCTVVEHICPPCPTSTATRGELEMAIRGQLDDRRLRVPDLRWWMGGYALVLADVKPTPWAACRGYQGLWTPPADVVAMATAGAGS